MSDSMYSEVVTPSDRQMWQEVTVKLDELVLHGDLRARSTLDGVLCERWSRQMSAHGSKVLNANRQPWPAVSVVEVDEVRYLVDGFHRIEAARRAGLTSFPARLKRGDWRDAMECSMSSNMREERKRTNEDKRALVRRALHEKEWAQLSDARVADLCGVSQPFVSKLRRDLLSAGEISPLSERMGADGRVYQVDKISGRLPGKAAKRAKTRHESAPGKAVAPIVRRRAAVLTLKDTPAQIARAAAGIVEVAPRTPEQDMAEWDVPQVSSFSEASVEPGSLSLLMVAQAERRHWYDVAHEGVPLLDKRSGLLLMQQTVDLPHAISHLMRQDIPYLGIVLLKDESAWHLWGWDEARAVWSGDSLRSVCEQLRGEQGWLMFKPAQG